MRLFAELGRHLDPPDRRQGSWQRQGPKPVPVDLVQGRPVQSPRTAADHRTTAQDAGRDRRKDRCGRSIGINKAEDNALDTLADARCRHRRQLQRQAPGASSTNLKSIGVGPKSPTRVVVFSERIATLDWLSRGRPRRPRPEARPGAHVLHGGMADVKQMDVIEEFGLADAPVRLLFTGDMASEGVNLHRQCHHLIHFDLPWSLITIEQRNGRIDRYGQTHSPDIRALVLQPDHPDCTGDVRILSRLLEREHTAHKAFGESASLLGLHSAELEEEDITKKLRDRVDPDTAIPEKPEKEFDLLTLLSGATGSEEVPTFDVPSLFGSDNDFVEEALRFAFDEADHSLDIRREADDPNFLSLVPPKDLANRFRALPQSYLAEQRITERLRLTGTRHAAEGALAAARASTNSQWPTVGHLSPLHPMLDWLVDKVFANVGRNEAPVLVADVDRPTFAILGSYSNGRGQPQLVEWMSVSVGADGALVSDLFATLSRARVHATMANPGADVPIDTYMGLIPTAVEAARHELDARQEKYASSSTRCSTPRANVSTSGEKDRSNSRSSSTTPARTRAADRSATPTSRASSTTPPRSSNR